MPHEQAQKARRCSPPSSTPQQQHAPRFHASEADDAYKLYIALPGERPWPALQRCAQPPPNAGSSTFYHF